MRVVVVEDEAPIREGMAKILSKINADYKVVHRNKIISLILHFVDCIPT